MQNAFSVELRQQKDADAETITVTDIFRCMNIQSQMVGVLEYNEFIKLDIDHTIKPVTTITIFIKTWI